MRRIDLLNTLSFGSQIAEEEIEALAGYFVQTKQWREIEGGNIDIVRGEKGAGKSAIYALLTGKVDSFFDNKTLLVAGENPRGDTVFKDLVTDPPTTEEEFRWLWKVYILTLVAQKLKEFGFSGSGSSKLYSMLEEAKLIEEELDLAGVLRRVQRLVRRLLRADFEAGIELDQVTSMPTGVNGKLSFKEPQTNLRSAGYTSVDKLLSIANGILADNGYKVWILLDRLDVAFADDHLLEANAMRALLRVYNDIRPNKSIALKIFVRDDIWRRAFSLGFREASHITRFVDLRWPDESLMNLMIRRILSNNSLVNEFGIDPEFILSSNEEQIKLFYRIFPDQIEQGQQKPTTFNWMISRCTDATDNTAPREVIHLMKSILEKEIERLEKGGPPASDGKLFDRSVFKQALIAVSRSRLDQYIYAEYASEKPYISALEGNKTEQTPESLCKLWEMDRGAALQKAEELRELGIFIRRDNNDGPTFWVPFLYRGALRLVQGRADDD